MALDLPPTVSLDKVKGDFKLGTRSDHLAEQPYFRSKKQWQSLIARHHRENQDVNEEVTPLERDHQGIY